MVEPGDLDSAFMGGFTETNVAAVESAHAAASSATREGPVARQRAETAAKAEARKAAKASKPAVVKAPAPAPAAAAVAAETEREAKHKLLKRVEGYRKLKPGLKPCGRAWCTASSSMQDIEDEVASAQHQLGEQPTTGLATNFLVNSLAAFEVLTQTYNPMALNLKGLGDFSKMKEAEFAPLVEEFMIKHGASLSLPVEVRIVMAIGSIVSLVHIANTNPAVAEALANHVNAPAPPPGVGQGM